MGWSGSPWVTAPGSLVCCNHPVGIGLDVCSALSCFRGGSWVLGADFRPWGLRWKLFLSK
jgi:hypothetical protein